MPGIGISGEYGAMPYNMLKEKYERTEIYEDPDSVNQHLREELKNMRCDEPTLASDFARENNFSEDRLELRHSGHRTGETPDLEDGTFLELTGQDPRGVLLDPRFEQAREQIVSRAPQYAFSDSADGSLPEREKPVQVLREQMRNAFAGVKDRLKIFTTSKDNLIRGHRDQVPTDSKLESTEAEAIIASITDAELRNDATAIMSNKINVGWDTVNDATFRIAQYGATNKSLQPSNGTRPVTIVPIKTESTESIARAAIAKTMLGAIEKSRHQDADPAKFRDTPEGTQLRSGEKKHVIATRNSSHEIKINKYADLATKHGKLTSAVGTNPNISVAKLQAIERMAQATARGVKHNTMEMQAAVAETMTRAVSMATTNRRADVTTASGISRAGNVAGTWAQSMIIAPLTSIMQKNAGSKQLIGDPYGSASKSFMANRWKQPTLAPQSTNTSQHVRNLDKTHDAFRGSMKKYIREATDNTVERNDISDLS